MDGGLTEGLITSPGRLDRALPAVPASVPRLRAELTQWARDAGVEDEQLHDVRLAVSEALTNAVIHAFVDTPPGTLRLQAETGTDVLEVRVVDDGGGMGPRPDSPGLGMGVPMIGKLCATVDLAEGPDGRGTEVRMVFAVPGLAAGTDGEDDHLAAILEALGEIGTTEEFGGTDIGALAELLVPRLGDVCGVTLLEADGTARRIGAHVVHPDGTPDPDATAWVMDFPVNATTSPSRQAAVTGRAVMVTVDQAFADRVSPDAASAATLMALGLTWWAAVPLRTGGRAVGAIALAGRRPASRSIVATLERVAAQAGGLVGTARLVEDLKRTQTRLTQILGALREAVTVSDREGRLVFANAAAVELLGAADAEEILRSTSAELGTRFLLTDEQGRPVHDAQIPAPQLFAGDPAGPEVLRVVERGSGVVRWMRMTATLLDEGELAVTVAQDVTVEKDAELRQRLLAEAGETLAATLGRPDTYARIARLTLPTLADCCFVDLLDDDGVMRPAFAEHVDPARDPAAVRTAADGARSINVPLELDGRTVGQMVLVNDPGGRTFSPQDAALAQDLARRAAIAVENARLHDERAAAQAELEATLRRLRLLADAGFGGLLRGIGDTIIEANTTFLEMVGYDSTVELPPWPLMTPPEWAHVDARAVAQMHATGTADVFEKEYLRRDGSRVRVLLGTTVADPETFEWLAVVVDVSERRAGDGPAHAGLDALPLDPGRASRAQVADVVSHLAAAVLIQRPGEGIVYANQAAADAMGMASPREVVAATPEQIAEGWDTFDEDGVPLEAARYPSRRLLLGEREVPPLTVRTINRATGREYWRVVRARAVIDDDGDLAMVVSMTEDITEMRRAMLTQRLLAGAGEVLSSSTDDGQTLQRLAALTVPELADWCSISLPDEHGVIRQAAVAHVDPAKVRFAQEYDRRYALRDDADDVSAAILRGGPSSLTPEITDAMLDAAITDPEQLALLRSIGMRSAVQVPIAPSGSAPIGVLSLINAESGRVFTEADLALAEELGRRAGTAVQNSRLHHERAHIAATLQASLLPDELPDVPGYALSCMYRPAGAENWVGGDFYDVFAVPNGWMVIVGDVAGHGAEAAALTAQARHTLRAIGEAFGDPVRAVAHLNGLLVPRAEPTLCTVCAVLLKEDAGGRAIATVTCAGHPLPLLVRDGAATPVGEWGPLLGAWESTFTAADIVLQDDDVLVLHTDGVREARAGVDRFGDERLEDALRDASGAQDAVSRVRVALDAFQVGPPSDDTAVLAVQRRR